MTFTGVVTSDGFGRMECRKCGNRQWKLATMDLRDAGWRLTLPVARMADGAAALAMLPEGQAVTPQAMETFASLPEPFTYRHGQQGMGYAVALALEHEMVLLANASVGIARPSPT